jgi:hypothetical protein
LPEGITSTERASIASLCTRFFFTRLSAYGCGAPTPASFLFADWRRLFASQALVQRIHQVDDVAFLFLFLRDFDRLACGLALDQGL